MMAKYIHHVVVYLDFRPPLFDHYFVFAWILFGYSIVSTTLQLYKTNVNDYSVYKLDINKAFISHKCLCHHFFQPALFKLPDSALFTTAHDYSSDMWDWRRTKWPIARRHNTLWLLIKCWAKIADNGAALNQSMLHDLLRIPSKHKTGQYLYNVRPALKTVGQHYTNPVFGCILFVLNFDHLWCYWNAVLVQCSLNVLPTLSQHTRGIHPILFKCLSSVEDGGPTLCQH